MRHMRRIDTEKEKVEGDRNALCNTGYDLYMHLCMGSAKKRMTCNRTIISGEKVV